MNVSMYQDNGDGAMIEGYNVVPSTVSQQIPVPLLKLMCSSNGIQNLLSRLQTQMVCVIQAQLASCLSKLLGSQPF